MQYYAPDYELDVRTSNMENANSPEYLSKIKIQVLENLKRTAFAPSVQMNEVPRDPIGLDDEADAELDDLDEDENKDSRWTERRWEKQTVNEGELSESEDEDMNERHGVRRQPGRKRRRNMMDYQNPNGLDDGVPSGATSSKRAGTRERNGNVTNQVSPSPALSSPLLNNGLSSSEPSPSEAWSEGDDNEGEDDDVDMADGPAASPPTNGTANGITAGPTRPQEATPPDSPPTSPAPALATAADTAGNDAMDEGDTLEEADAQAS